MMNRAKNPRAARWILAVGSAALLGCGVYVMNAPVSGLDTVSAVCPPGFHPHDAQGGRVCVTDKHPEPPLELELRQRELLQVRSAPFDTVHAGAFAAAIAERENLRKSGTKVQGTAGTWQPYGTGPLIANSPAYSSINGLGLADMMGRIDSLKYDPANNRLFAATGTGGVWMSTDLGNNWVSIGDSLPSQIVGAIAWSPAGTLVALSGDPTFGGISGYTGFGAFYTTDLGATWQKATGIPDGALGFAIEVDPANPDVVYAATMFGLYRSADAGRTYFNVSLPTGDCAGVPGNTTGRPECHLANVVTDVVIRAPEGTESDAPGDVPPGTVLAAVGWRGGQKRFTRDGIEYMQSPNNGLYRSTSGEPGTFEKLEVPGFTPQDRIGRIELGPAVGPQQDHDIVYAIVQDAQALNGFWESIDVTDVNDPRPLLPTVPLLGKLGAGGGTVLQGIYSSTDFGATWTLMADDTAIAKNLASGSALNGVGTSIGFEPGIQAWYNLFIAPDPTRAVGGVPTRLVFGLEEVWQNDVTVQPALGPTAFKVIGRYFSGDSCMLLDLGLPVCPVDHPPSGGLTTHPDQHDAIWVPDGAGGVTLLVGNDGGFYKQHAAMVEEMDNGGWGPGNQAGFNTLLPYDVAMANDGTVYAGLQDNGHMKILPTGQQFATFGGDGTFALVDPANSNVAYEATPGGSMRVSQDGGRSWRSMPPPVTNTRFVNPFEMDPADANHIVTGGNEIAETIHGPQTGLTGTPWAVVYDLGTAQRPGDPAAAPTATDPNNQMSAITVQGDAVYVGFCGLCDIINATAPFKNGLATNVGGALPPRRMTADGWHIARAAGLPNRFITSIAIDPVTPTTIYVTLGGYSRKWLPPGSLQDDNQNVGTGHLFKSTDAGETFVDISGNLPDVPANWVVLRGPAPQLLVGTELGVFANDVNGGTTFMPLTGSPVVPITTMQLKPDNPNLLVAAFYGRGIWTYRFAKAIKGTKGSGEIPEFSTPPEPLNQTLAGPFDFELGDDGWTVGTNSANPLMVWRRGAPGHASTNSFQVVPYTDQSTTTLTLTGLSHAGGWVFVDFHNRRNTEPGFDFMHVEWSPDGARWTPALWVNRGAGWRDDLTFDAKNPSYPAFDAERVAFEAPAGALQVRFRFSSDELISAPLYEGVWVDTVRIYR